MRTAPEKKTATFQQFLRATAVPAGTAEARISYGNSVCLSVCLSITARCRNNRV